MDNPKKKPLWRKAVEAVASGLVIMVVLAIGLFGSGSVETPGWVSFAFIGVFFFAVVVGLFIVVRLATTKGRTGSPEDVVKTFYRAVQKGDLDSAHELFHRGLQRAQNRREFRRLDTDLSRLLRKTPRGWGTHSNDQSARVITYRGSTLEEIASEFLLTMQDGAWEITAYRANDELGRIEGGRFQKK